MTRQDRSGLVGTGQVKSGQVRTGRVRLKTPRQVGTGQERLRQVVSTCLTELAGAKATICRVMHYTGFDIAMTLP